MNNKNLPKIKVTKDGPYLVSGSLPLRTEKIVSDEAGTSIEWQETKKYPELENYSLCRCGNSSNKPFCDGSHARCDFDGTEQPQTPFYDQAERHEGAELILYDAYDLCASARFCDRSGSIWSLIREDSERSKKIAIEEAANCSSGRLVVSDKSNGEVIEPALTPSISVTQDPVAGVSGPLWVKGGVPIESADGAIYEKRNRVTLCRCGKSKNMPFCDSSHVHTKFDDGNATED